MIVRAEMRMADEVDRGQATGEVEKAGGARNFIVPTPGNENGNAPRSWSRPSPRARVRKVRDAGPAVVEQAIERACGPHQRGLGAGNKLKT